MEPAPSATCRWPAARRWSRSLRARGHDVISIDTARGLLTGEEEHRWLTAGGVGLQPPKHEELAVLGADAKALMSAVPDMGKVDVVFLALHGGSGEDGTIQAFLDLAGMAYTGSGHLASAAAMDKDISKKLFCAAGIPTPEWLMDPVTPEEVETKLGYPSGGQADRAGIDGGPDHRARPGGPRGGDRSWRIATARRS